MVFAGGKEILNGPNGLAGGPAGGRAGRIPGWTCLL